MRLKEIREEKGLTQQEIADKIGTSQTNIARWEKEQNEPTSSNLISLANYLSCSIDYLVGREDDFGNIVINGNNEFELTKEEITLLNEFNKLTNVNKYKVLGYIHALV